MVTGRTITIREALENSTKMIKMYERSRREVLDVLYLIRKFKEGKETEVLDELLGLVEKGHKRAQSSLDYRIKVCNKTIDRAKELKKLGRKDDDDYDIEVLK